MQYGLVENGKILVKKEKDFSQEDKADIKRTIIKTIEKYIEEIVKMENIKTKDIELIGIAAPRNM